MHSALNSLQPMVRLFQCKVSPPCCHRDRPLPTNMASLGNVSLSPGSHQGSCHRHMHPLPTVENEDLLYCTSRSAPPGVPLTFGVSVSLAVPQTLWPGVLTPLPPISTSAEDPLFGATLPPILCFRYPVSTKVEFVYLLFNFFLVLDYFQ